MPPEPSAGLEPLDRLGAIAGLLLFASTFLPWFTYSLDGGGVFRDTSSTVTGWEVGLGWGGLPAVLGLAVAGVAVAARWADEPVRLPATPGVRHLGAGGLAAALVASVVAHMIGEGSALGLLATVLGAAAMAYAASRVRA